MLLNIENLDYLLRENGIKESQLENTREHIFKILKSAERDKKHEYGRIKTITIPKDKEYLFWYIVNEFEKIQYEWGNKELSRAQLSSSYLNNIITGKISFEHNHLNDNGKNYLLLKDKSKPEGFCRLEIPQNISINYKLHFYFFPRKKEIVVKRCPPVISSYEPIYEKGGVLTIAGKRVYLKPHLMALFVLFLKNSEGIKKEELEEKYDIDNEIYNEIIRSLDAEYEKYKKLYEENRNINDNEKYLNELKVKIAYLDKEISHKKQYKRPTKDNLCKNFPKYSFALNRELEEQEIMPIYYIRQYKGTKQGEKYFLSIHFINNGKVKRR